MNPQSLTDGRRHKVDLHGVTWPVTIAVEHVGQEADLCGGYRPGFYRHHEFCTRGLSYRL